jgi:hypothetical protein
MHLRIATCMEEVMEKDTRDDLQLHIDFDCDPNDCPFCIAGLEYDEDYDEPLIYDDEY